MKNEFIIRSFKNAVENINKSVKVKNKIEKPIYKEATLKFHEIKWIARGLKKLMLSIDARTDLNVANLLNSNERWELFKLIRSEEEFYKKGQKSKYYKFK